MRTTRTRGEGGEGKKAEEKRFVAANKKTDTLPGIVPIFFRLLLLLPRRNSWFVAHDGNGPIQRHGREG
jgi:hypothetical protein